MGILTDKVVLITGAGRGIGRDFALACAEHGAKVLVNDYGANTKGTDIEGSPASEVVKEIEALGGYALADNSDVSNFSSVEKMFETTIKNFGKIDAVINNAGILRDKIFHKMSLDDWKAVIDVHLNGSFNVSRIAADHFRQQEKGAFVHMTSTSGLVGNFGQANYAAAKLGIAALSKSIALDMERYNVRSNCIAPFAWTRMIGTIPITDESQKERIERLKAMTPAKIAPMAIYLVSDLATDVTGQIFAVRNNEIFLMSQNRPLRSIHRSDEWTAEKIAEHAIPALKQDFYSLHRSQDIWPWDPV
ncbi:MAG: 3-hydroxyacyl-CoA dehydrogenase [Methylococcaceae bacterium TMED69]|nr:SDR family oxidoreductase [Pseudomonadota bacterium]OUU76077.1 MAG: 3-hydroxyacyl-CoA dehydrogenase [Methylococcaceae bacterium TMED69]